MHVPGDESLQVVHQHTASIDDVGHEDRAVHETEVDEEEGLRVREEEDVELSGKGGEGGFS